MATVGQTISFLRPVANDDVLVEARVLRLGRTLAFGEVALRAAGSGALAAHATTTYALPPSVESPASAGRRPLPGIPPARH